MAAKLLLHMAHGCPRRNHAIHGVIHNLMIVHFRVMYIWIIQYPNHKCKKAGPQKLLSCLAAFKPKI